MSARDLPDEALTHRAHALFVCKGVTDDPNYFYVDGIATTPTPDHIGDVVEPLGVKFSLPFPMLWQHNHQAPVGEVYAATASAEGISFKGRIPKVKEPGLLKDRLDEAIHSLKYGLVKGTSIGFKAVRGKVEQMKSGGLRFMEWTWFEHSLVTIPMNAEATITNIKSFDDATRAAIGRNPGDVLRIEVSPGDSGKSIYLESKGKNVNIQENITSFESKRSALIAEMQAIVEKSIEDGRTLDTAEKEKHAELKSDLAKADSHLETLRDHQKMLAQTAKPVVAVTTDTIEGVVVSKSVERIAVGDGVLRANANLPPGIGLARYAKALCFARVNMCNPVDYAKQQWGDSQPEVAEMLQKTAVAAGTTTDSTWASPLVYANNLASEFLSYLRPKTLLGRLEGVRKVPFNIRYPIQNGGSTVAWVGQGAPKPVSKLSFTSATLGFAKAAGIVVITQELARFSSPAAEMAVRDDMAAQMAYFLDQQFIDPGVAAVANVSPASILNGASNIRQAAATWTTMANVLTDVYALMSTFAANEITLDGAVWIMTPDAALRLSLLLTTGGENFAFPGLTINGGTFLGIPVLVTNIVPHSVSAGSIVALIKPSEILLADDGGVNISVSGEASLNMDTAPTNNSATPTATSVVSMFQTDSIAIRCERFINWSVRRAYGVGYIDNMHTS